MKSLLCLTLAVAVLASGFLCCGTSTTPRKVGTEPSEPPTEAPKAEMFKVGDVVEVKDHTIILNAAKVEGEKLIVTFTVENKSGEEMTVSSLLSFSARGPDGSNLDVALCDGSQLDGSIVAGDKLKGDICWKGVSSTAGVKVYYEASLLGSSVVWELD